MQHQSCLACGSHYFTNRILVPDFEYATNILAEYQRCKNCCSEQQFPMPNSKELASYYPANYHSFNAPSFIHRLKYAMRVKRIKSLLNGEGAILDLGCGNGAFLVYLANSLPKHKRLYGYEIADKREITRLVDGRVTIIRGTYDDLTRILPECSLITMNHVIEHLSNPRELIDTLKGHLIPNGVIEGQTPATQSVEQRIFKHFWSGYHSPRHTIVFSKSGLCKLLGQAGLSGIKLNSAFNPAGLAISLASVFQRDTTVQIPRKGLRWLCFLGISTLLSPLDLLFGPAVVNFSARLPTKQ